MRKFSVFLITILIVIIGITGCKKKYPTACFTVESESLMDNEDIQIKEEISFINCSENTELFLWEFGDGTKSTEENPVHKYTEQGKYIVKLTSYGEDKGLEDFYIVTINIAGPTILSITVIASETNVLVHDCEVYIFETKEDVKNLKNYIFGFTDQSGQVVFDEGLKSIEYYVYAFYPVNDNYAWIGGIITDELEKAENNEYIIYVEYTQLEPQEKSIGIDFNKSQ